MSSEVASTEIAMANTETAQVPETTAITGTSEIGTVEIAGAGTASIGTAQIPEEYKSLIEKINSGNLGVVAGAYGDMEFCEGLVERVIEPIEGGRFTKFYGCDMLFKGYPLKGLVEGLGFPKSFLSMLPRKIIAPSRFWKINLLLRYLFGRKYFWHDLHIIFFSIYINSVQKVNLPYIRFNKPSRVLKDAIDRALSVCMDFENRNLYKISLLHGDIHVINKIREIWETIALIAEFIYLILDYDNAYRFRLQDALATVKKDNLKGFGTVREVIRLFDLLIEREDHMHGIRNKWKELKRVVVPILVIDKDLRRFVRLFLQEIDTEAIALDEADWYFCLKRRSYNFRGVPLKDRLTEREKINKERGYKYIQLITLRNEKGEVQKGIHII